MLGVVVIVPVRSGTTIGRTGPYVVLPRGRKTVEVVIFVITETARVWRLLHALLEGSQQLVLRPNVLGTRGVGHLEIVRHRQGTSWACLDAHSAQNAAQIVDLVNATVTLTRRVTLLVSVICPLDVDGIGRARPCTQLTTHTLFQPVRPAVELVTAMHARRHRLFLALLRVSLGEGLAEHRLEGDPESGPGSHHRPPFSSWSRRATVVAVAAPANGACT